MTVWDDAKKLASAEGSVWDQALALKERPETETTPDEAYAEGKDTLNLSVEYQLPLETVENNYDEISVWDPKDEEVEEYPEQPQLIAGPEPGFWEKFLKAGYQGAAKPDHYWEMNRVKRFAFDSYLATRNILTRIGGVVTTQLGLTEKKEVLDLYEDELANNPEWYTKAPEATGFVIEKVAEYYALKGVFKATGLHKMLSLAGQKLSAPFISKAIVARGGVQAVNTLSRAGLKQVTMDGVAAFLRFAPENTAFLAAWSAGGAALQDEDISEAALAGGLWGIGFSALTPVVGGLGKIAIATKAGQKLQFVANKAYTSLWQNHPRIMNAGRKPFSDEFLEEAKRQYKARFGIDPTAADVAKLKKMTRMVGDEITRQAQKDAAMNAYWNSGAKKAQEVAQKAAAVKPTEAPKAAVTKPVAAVKPTKPVTPTKVAPKPAKPLEAKQGVKMGEEISRLENEIEQRKSISSKDLSKLSLEPMEKIQSRIKDLKAQLEAKPEAVTPKVTPVTPKPTEPPPDVTPKQIAEVAEKLPEAEISQKPVTVGQKKFYPVTLPTESIGVDPKKFQFKLGAKLAGGVTEALKDVEAFDPVKAGQILVWQDKAGKYWVIDGHHRVALAKKTGAESLQTWVLREADGVTAADARAIGALRNLADGKGTAIDAAKLFRDSDITLEKLKKQGVPTNNIIVKQGLDMKELSDHVFRLVVDEKLPPSFAAPIGRQVKTDAQQKQVADLILEGEIDTVRQAELLAATIDTAPVLTTQEQTLFGLETTEKSLFAERAKVLANVEKRLKTNKKVFGVLATQTGIIEAKGNILQKVENLAAKEKAEEVLFMLEKLANSKGPIAEALNDATKEYAKNPTKETLAKVTGELLIKWTEGPGRLRVPGQEGVSQLPLERAGQKAVAKPLDFETPAPELFIDPKKPTEFFGGKRGGFIDFTPLAKAQETFMSIIEPSKAVEITQGKDVYAEVIKAIHKPDVAMVDFNEKQLETLDSTLGEWGKSLAKYPNRILELLMLSRGKAASKEAIIIQEEALEKLAKEAPELVGTRKMITRASDFNYDYLVEVVGDEVGYIDDYFYGVYKDPRLVENFLKHWKTTKRFTKQKKLPTVADAKAFGLELRHLNPVDNLRSEYMAIARLEGMINLKAALMESGEGEYIDKTENAQFDWNEVFDPVFRDVRVAPELARMINNLISTNKISRIPALNTLRQINNFLRTVKFVGSAFHLTVEAKQALADSGYLGFLEPTARRGLTLGFKPSDPIFQTPEYKDYLTHGGGHRFSIDSEAQRAFTNAIDKMGKAGIIAKGVALPFQVPEKFVRWMFENYIPKLKYSKYLDTVSEQEQKLARSLKSSEKIDIVKEAQNFYGMMNERLFGRSGTVTTLLRLKFMAPGFAEGNFRTILKAILQWGGNKGFSAHRSRANIINSFIVSAVAATVGTIFLTGRPPKKPEKLSDIRDLFKINTGKVDQHGRPIMVDMLTYDKDYWDVFGNLIIGQPGKAVETTFKRLGGMTATTWEVLSDLNQMSMGRTVYDWKGDRIVEITDPFIQKVLKLSIHELKKAEPISTNVFHQARQKGVGVALSAAMTLAGVRLTKTEQDKRELEILSQIFSLRDQQETLFWYLGSIKNPREQIKKYNQTVMRILDNPVTPLDVKDEFEPKLIIDVKRLTANKVHSFLGDQAKLAELRRSPEKHQKEIKELQGDSVRSLKWLRNFDITDKQYKGHLVEYEKLHRKIVKEIQPEDDQEELRDNLAKFYADQTILKRRIQSGIGNNKDKRLARKYSVISDNIAEIARRVYDTEDEEKRDSLFGRMKSAVKRIKQGEAK